MHRYVGRPGTVHACQVAVHSDAQLLVHRLRSRSSTKRRSIFATVSCASHDPQVDITPASIAANRSNTSVPEQDVRQQNSDQQPRDDDVLPDSLTDAILQASESTITAIEAGNSGVVAEVLLGEFWDPGSGAVFAEEGDQQRFWKLTRKFADNLVKLSDDGASVRVLYPDMGVAAMLTNQWTDADFSIGSMSDRTPIRDDDDIIVFAAPDPQALESAKRISAQAREAGKVVVMFNPRLASGDVGVGLNVRRMMMNFMGSFTVAYSLRPIGDIGTVFRRYPGQWQVFLEDTTLPGRFTLAAQCDERPAGEALDLIIQAAFGGPSTDLDEQQGFTQQLGRTVSSLQRFMRSLTR